MVFLLSLSTTDPSHFVYSRDSHICLRVLSSTFASAQFSSPRKSLPSSIRRIWMVLDNSSAHKGKQARAVRSLGCSPSSSLIVGPFQCHAALSELAGRYT